MGPAGSADEERTDETAISGPVLLHALEPRRGRHHGEAVPPKQNCGRVVLERRPGRHFGRHGVRAGKERLDGAHDSQYRGAAGERCSAAGYFHAAHGQVYFADARQGWHQPFWRSGEPAHRFADFHAGGFNSGDDRGGHGGPLSGPEDCGHDVDR